MRRQFPLFQSHLDLAHHYWLRLVEQGDSVIDATCGNGHDTLYLANLALNEEKGHLLGLDIQEPAIASTRLRLERQLAPKQLARIELCQQSHATFPQSAQALSIKLVVYNLGYLPSGDKSITTQCDTVLASLAAAKELICPGGAISITLYPGHEEGKRETERLAETLCTWSKEVWSVCHHRWLNRHNAPELLMILRNEVDSPACKSQ